MGVRKFNDVYTKGDSPDKKNTTTNKDRRDARLMRRQIRRKRNRRRTTLEILRSAGLAVAGDNPFPGLAAFRFSPYDIWAKAYDTDLTPLEFGRLMYLLAHRRGFKSNLGAGIGELRDRPEIAAYLDELEAKEAREAAAKDAKSKGKPAGEDADEGKTLAQVGHWRNSFSGVPLGKFFFALLNPGQDGEALAQLAADPAAATQLRRAAERQQIRNRASNPLWARPDRAAYEEEFDRLWDRQAKQLGLSDALRFQLHRALFFQNPLEFPAENRGFCNYGKVVDEESGELLPAHRAPKCNLLFQEYRLWKLLADMKVKSNPLEDFRDLTRQEKEALFERLNSQGEVSWTELGKAIAIPKAIFEPSERKQTGGDYTAKGMVGNRIAAWFRSVKPESPAGEELIRLWENPERFLTESIKAEVKGTTEGKRDAVRHRLVRLIGEAPFSRFDRNGEQLPKASLERVVTLIQSEFDLGDVAAFRLAQTSQTSAFPSGFGNLSYIAMARLLPHLREGKKEWEAIRDEFGERRVGENPEPLGYVPAPPDAHEILSPRVRKTLNQVRHVINALREEIPDLEIDEIRIELARRMQLGNEEYKSLTAYQAYNEKMNQKAEQFWNSCRPGVAMPRQFPLKYRLWEEQGHECPYSTGPVRKISIEHLVEGTEIEIEHIWPRQIGGDSYANKVLVFRTQNQQKGGNPPWEMSEVWRQTVANNMQAWPLLGRKSVDAASTQEAKPSSLGAPPKAVDIARSKIRRVLTAKRPPQKDSDFSDRQAVETGYIAREAVTYLEPAAKKVTAVKSTFSTSLARNWGFYKRLNQIHQDDLGKIPRGKKDRILLRHHAVDALATALCSPKVIARIVALEKEQYELRDPKQALKEVSPESFVPVEDAEIRAKWLRKRLGELQPKTIANGLGGALANIVVSYESRQRPRGKFFTEQPLGISKKDADKPVRTLNRRVAITALKAVQVFPELKPSKKSKDDEQEEGATSRGAIRSALTRQRIADYLTAQGFGSKAGVAKIDEYLKTLTDGVPFEANGGTRWVRKVLVSAPLDRMDNYFIRDSEGGRLLYSKLERHVAVIVPNGKKSFMEVVPLVDAAVGLTVDQEEYRDLMIGLAATRGKRPLTDFQGASIFHKGDLIQIRKHTEAQWHADFYVVEVIDGAGRLWLRAQWSADRETLKDKAIGSVIASASVFEFRPVKVSPSGYVVEP